MSTTRLDIDGRNANSGVFAVQDDVAYMISGGSEKIAQYLSLKTEDERVAHIMANYDEFEPLSQAAADMLRARGIAWTAPQSL